MAHGGAIKCPTCLNWFMQTERICPHCYGMDLDDPAVPWKLTEEDVRFLRIQGVLIDEDEDDCA